MSNKRKMSSELTIMSLWETLSDEGKLFIADWAGYQIKRSQPAKPKTTPRAKRSDSGTKRKGLPPIPSAAQTQVGQLGNGGDTNVTTD